MNNQEFLNKVLKWMNEKLDNYEFVNEIEIYKSENCNEYSFTNYELSIKFPEISIPYFIRITLKGDKIFCELDDEQPFEYNVDIDLLDNMVIKRRDIIKEYINNFIDNN